MFILAQLFGTLVIISNIISMQMKKKKHIVFMFILGNLFSAANFILIKGYSGAIICIFSIVQSLINNIFENRDQKVPRLIILIYIIISVILGAITFRNYIDILPIVCSILYTITIIQVKEKNIRKISLVNILLWLIFDITYKAYTASISDLLMVSSTLVGMYRYDYKQIFEQK